MKEQNYDPAQRKELLKHMILQLHEGIAPEEIKQRLIDLMQKIPYGEVVEVEQELINEGLPEEEVLRLCDLHTMVLEDSIDLSGAQKVPPGHPVDTFQNENRELEKVSKKLDELYQLSDEMLRTTGAETYINSLRSLFNSLMDVDKHYRRKENLLFPFLEKYGITGPPKVMWGKHEETRALLRQAIESLMQPGEVTPESMNIKIQMSLKPASKAITDMIIKEEEILLPMTMDKLTNEDWYQIYKQTNEIGYCLFDPKVEWRPEGIELGESKTAYGNNIQLPSGRFSVEELLANLNSLPVDLTFVDNNDKVKYFSQGSDRIFDRNRAILGRDVRMCHPPSSVHIVERIIDDFRNGSEKNCAFWIQMKDRFIHIEYVALHNDAGEYLGTLEISQDLTEKRKLEGEKRILSYHN